MPYQCLNFNWVFVCLIFWHLKRSKPLFPIPLKNNLLKQIVEEECQKHSLWLSEICWQTMSNCQNKTWNRKTLENRKSSWVKVDYKTEKNSYTIHGWKFWSGEDNTAICKWFYWFLNVLPIFLLTRSFTITCFPKPKMFDCVIHIISKILLTEFCIHWLIFLLNPNRGQFCMSWTRFFHWLTLWLS